MEPHHDWEWRAPVALVAFLSSLISRFEMSHRIKKKMALVRRGGGD